jgi:predicted TIM-barrel fold metal-dependent hydrolase
MIIDYASRPPAPEFSQTAATHLTNYRRVYEASEKLVGPEPDATALQDYLRTYDDLGAHRVVIKARDLETTFGFKILNDDVAAFCRKNAPRFLGFAGADPHKGMDAVRELERSVKELGLVGLNLQCFEHKLRANDKKMYPLYAKCVELGVPVNIHCGLNFSTSTPMSFGRPEDLDEVLVDFPELRICASPPGWPWCEELVAVAWRHPNLWIGLVAVRPKYLAAPESGYGALLRYGATLLRDRIIFGSAYPMMPVARSVQEVSELPIPEKVRRHWLFDNAARFLRLEAEPGG